jgi:hypothetical protein
MKSKLKAKIKTCRIMPAVPCVNALLAKAV